MVTLRAAGAVIGGMTYRLDAALERPAHVAGARTQEDERCRAQAARLLECLDLPGQNVSGARVKKITVEISIDDDCA